MLFDKLFPVTGSLLRAQPDRWHIPLRRFRRGRLRLTGLYHMSPQCSDRYGKALVGWGPGVLFVIFNLD